MIYTVLLQIWYVAINYMTYGAGKYIDMLNETQQVRSWQILGKNITYRIAKVRSKYPSKDNNHIHDKHRAWRLGLWEFIRRFFVMFLSLIWLGTLLGNCQLVVVATGRLTEDALATFWKGSSEEFFSFPTTLTQILQECCGTNWWRLKVYLQKEKLSLSICLDYIRD